MKNASKITKKREAVNEIIGNILTKPRMSLDEGGRNHIVPLSPKDRREVASLLRKANLLMSTWLRNERGDRSLVIEAGALVRAAIRRLEPTKGDRP
jgi:hypothetical protein